MRQLPPRIDKNLCDGCGICVWHCGVEALGFRMETDKAYLAKPRTCVDCFVCQEVCPEHAVVIVPAKDKIHSEEKGVAPWTV